MNISPEAEIDGRVAGHIAISPVTIADRSTGWYGLGPALVWPEHQGQGIGKSLINKGLSMLEDLGGQGCILVGDSGFCQRFGFRNVPELVYEGIPQELFLVLPFTRHVPQGIAIFHQAFLASDWRAALKGRGVRSVPQANPRYQSAKLLNQVKPGR